MRYTDIAIIGGGLAGSTAAAMLGRAGIPTLVIDPHQTYPFDFRVEKLSGGTQVDLLTKTGIADSVLRSTTHDGENWIARFGYLLDFSPQYDAIYLQWMLALYAQDHDPVLYRLAADNARNAESRAARSAGLYLRSWNGETLPAQYAVPGMLQTHAATTSLFAWLAVYAPPGQPLEITASSEVCEVALCWAPAERGVEPALIRARSRSTP